MDTYELRGRVKKIFIEPKAGDDVDTLKNTVRQFCISNNCRAYFYHNDKKFICDGEGNIAKTNKG